MRFWCEWLCCFRAEALREVESAQEVSFFVQDLKTKGASQVSKIRAEKITPDE